MSSTIVIIDTSVFDEVLAIPGWAKQHGAILDELVGWLEDDARLLLPVAVIIESGNHVAQSNAGRLRRLAAQRFVAQVDQALRGESPFTVTPSLLNDELAQWLPNFVEHATRGVGLADMSLIEEWERQRELSPGRRVLIWSLDEHLAGYDTGVR